MGLYQWHCVCGIMRVALLICELMTVMHQKGGQKGVVTAFRRAGRPCWRVSVGAETNASV